MKEDVSFMLYLGRPDCGDCQAFKPILEDYLNKHPNEGVYYLNIKAYRDASLKEDATKEEKKSSIRISIKHLILIGHPH